MRALGGILNDLVGALRGEKKVFAGNFDVKLGEKVHEIEVEHEKLHKEVKSKVQAYIKQLNEEHAPICKEMNTRMQAAWEAIYDAAGIPEADRKKEYQIDRKTGVIFRIDTIEPGANDDSTNTGTVQ